MARVRAILSTLIAAAPASSLPAPSIKRYNKNNGVSRLVHELALGIVVSYVVLDLMFYNIRYIAGAK